MPLSTAYAGVIIAVLLIASACAAVWRPAIPPEAAHKHFSTEQVSRGAELAAVGNCAVCHTHTDGPAFAGGRGVSTPFGTIYSTNITPDPETGIGQWSAEAFRRAMRDGIDRAGRHLYPVPPYPHLARATDADIAALYAFMMTRVPVHATSLANQLVFPLNNRVLLAGWNMLYLKPGAWHADPAHDAAWNQGAYLVEAIGHCGACHSPHNQLGAEKSAQALAGGQAKDWHTPPLQAASPAHEPWTRNALAAYLRTGFDAKHGAAAGPMTAVTEQLGRVPDADILAMADYIASLMPKSVHPEGS